MNITTFILSNLFVFLSCSPLVLHETCITVYLFQSISSDFPKSHKKLWYVLLPSFPSSKIHFFTHLRAPSFHYLLSSGDNYDWNSLGTNHNLCSKLWKWHFLRRSMWAQTQSYSSLQDISPMLLFYTPTELLRTYRCIKTWDCFCRSAGTG